MALGEALGIDTSVLAGIINSSTGRCWSSEMYNPWPASSKRRRLRAVIPAASVPSLMLKDLGLATEAARQAHQPVVLGAVAQQLYQAMSQRGDGGKDFSAIINSYRKPAIEGQR
jgi:3-hydroxyisobutyrate dehydrogenase